MDPLLLGVSFAIEKGILPHLQRESRVRFVFMLSAN